MALKKNVYTDDLMTFLDSCCELNHIMNFTHRESKATVKKIDKALEYFRAKGWKEDAYFAGTGLSIIDVFHTGSWVVRRPSVKQVTMGQNIRRLAIEMEGRSNAQFLANLHERLEDYLKVVYGRFRYQIRNSTPLKNVNAFQKAKPNIDRSQKGTPNYYDEYAKFICKRDCNQALTDLQELLDWGDIQVSCCGGLEFHEFLEVVATCRHLTVHKGGRIISVNLKKLNLKQKAFVKAITNKGVHGGHDLVLPDKKTTESCVESAASYAYAIYVLLAKKCMMKVEYDP